jgi:superfamily II DNA/RNA helicase
MFSGGLRLRSVLCVGGMSLHKQVIALNQRPQVIIGTPGRLKDLVNRNRLNLSKAGILIFDEVDRMLDMGFINDINFLIGYLPKERQSLCFSATLTPAIEKVIANILDNPITVSVRTNETSETINQDIIRYTSPMQKHQLLEDILRKQDVDKVLIFGQTKHGVQKLSDDLVAKGFKSKAIHGNKTQPQRQKALDSFKNNQVSILVATDVAARGLDIPNVSHVINFDQPNTYEDYVHRIGRTGRAGKAGQALTFVK